MSDMEDDENTNAIEALLNADNLSDDQIQKQKQTAAASLMIVDDNIRHEPVKPTMASEPLPDVPMAIGPPPDPRKKRKISNELADEIRDTFGGGQSTAQNIRDNVKNITVNYNRKCNKFTREISNLKETVRTLKSAKEKMLEDMILLQSAKSESAQEISNLNSTIEQFQNLVSEKQNTNKIAEDEIAKLNQTLSTERDKNQKQLEQFFKTQGDAYGEINQLEKSIEDLKGTISGQRTNYDKLKSSYNDIKANNESVKAENGELESKVIHFQNISQQLEDANIEHIKEINDVKSKKDELVKQNEELKQQVEKVILQESSINYQELHSRFTMKLKEFETKENEYKQNLKTITAEKGAFERKFKEAETKRTSLSKKIKTKDHAVKLATGSRDELQKQYNALANRFNAMTDQTTTATNARDRCLKDFKDLQHVYSKEVENNQIQTEALKNNFQTLKENLLTAIQDGEKNLGTANEEIQRLTDNNSKLNANLVKSKNEIEKMKHNLTEKNIAVSNYEKQNQELREKIQKFTIKKENVILTKPPPTPEEVAEANRRKIVLSRTKKLEKQVQALQNELADLKGNKEEVVRFKATEEEQIKSKIILKLEEEVADLKTKLDISSEELKKKMNEMMNLNKALDDKNKRIQNYYDDSQNLITELNNLTESENNLRNKNKDLDDLIKNKNKELKELNKDLEKLTKSKKEELEKLTKSKKEEVDRLTQNKDDLKIKNDKLKSKKNELNEKNNELNEALQTLQEQRKSQTKIEQDEQQSLQNELSDLKENLKRKTFDLNDEIQKLQNEVKKTNRKLTDKTGELEALNQKLDKTKSSYDEEIKKLKERYEKKIKDLDKTTIKKESDHEELKKDIEKLEEMVSSYERKIRQLEDEIQELKTSLESSAEREEALGKEFQDLSETLNQTKSKHEITKSNYERKLENIQRTLDQSKSEHENAIRDRENQELENIQKILHQSKSEHKKAIRELENTQKVKLDLCDKTNQELTDKYMGTLNQLKEVTKIQTAEENETNQLKKDVQQLDKIEKYNREMLTTKITELKNCKGENTKLIKEIKLKTTDLENCKGDLETHKEENTKLKKKVIDLKGILEDELKSISKYKNDNKETLTHKDTDLENCRMENKKLKNDVETLKQSVSKYKKDIDTLNSDYVKNINTIKDELNQSESETKELKGKLDEKNDILNEVLANSDCEEERKQIEKLEKEVAELKATLDEKNLSTAEHELGETVQSLYRNLEKYQKRYGLNIPDSDNDDDNDDDNSIDNNINTTSIDNISIDNNTAPMDNNDELADDDDDDDRSKKHKPSSSSSRKSSSTTPSDFNKEIVDMTRNLMNMQNDALKIHMNEINALREQSKKTSSSSVIQQQPPQQQFDYLKNLLEMQQKTLTFNVTENKMLQDKISAMNSLQVNNNTTTTTTTTHQFSKYVFSYNIQEGTTMTPIQLMVVDPKDRIEFDTLWRYMDTDVDNHQILMDTITELGLYSTKVVKNHRDFKKYLKSLTNTFKTRCDMRLGMYMFQTGKLFNYTLYPIKFDVLQNRTNYSLIYALDTVARFDILIRKNVYYIVDLSEYKSVGQKLYPSDAVYRITQSNTYKDLMGNVLEFENGAADNIPDDVYKDLENNTLYTSSLHDKLVKKSYLQVRRINVIDDFTGIERFKYRLVDDMDETDQEFSQIPRVIRELEPILNHFEKINNLENLSNNNSRNMQYNRIERVRSLNTLHHMIYFSLFEHNDIFVVDRDLGLILAKLYVFCAYYNKYQSHFAISLRVPRWFQNNKEIILAILNDKAYSEVIRYFFDHINRVGVTRRGFSQMWAVLETMYERDEVIIGDNYSRSPAFTHYYNDVYMKMMNKT